MKKIVLFIVLLGCLLAGQAAGERKEDLAWVVVINSDSSVHRYQSVSRSFMKNLPFILHQEDLGGSVKAIEKIKRRIHDKNPRLIYCIGSKALFFASKELKEYPLVFSSAINWERFNLSPKAIGIAAEISAEAQITLFRYIFPEVDKIGIIYSTKFNKQWFEKSRELAQSMGAELVGVEYNGTSSIEEVIERLAPKVEALWLIPDPLVVSRKTVKAIFPLLNRWKKPVFAYSSAFIEIGASLSISSDNDTVGRQASALVQEILEGQIVEERIQNPAGSFISLNLAKVNEYGVEINPSAMGSINRVFE